MYVPLLNRRPIFFLQVAKSLNVLWLVSASSLEDPFCLMEVCAAVRQGTPVLPVRLAGAGMRPLNLPIWAYSIVAKPSQSTAAAAADADAAVADADAKASNKNKISPTTDTSGGVENRLATAGGDDTNAAAETRERACRLRRRAADGFYVQLAQRLPKSVQAEFHRNNFLVKDVLAAVRVCFENAEESGGDTELASAGAIGTQSGKAAAAAASNPKPPIFDLSAPPADHEKVLTALVGVNCPNTGEGGFVDIVGRQEGRGLSSPWNWEQVPQKAPLAGRARVNDAVPWRTDEELSEMMRMENAEADDLAGGYCLIRGTRNSILITPNRVQFQYGSELSTRETGSKGFVSGARVQILKR